MTLEQKHPNPHCHMTASAADDDDDEELKEEDPSCVSIPGL